MNTNNDIHRIQTMRAEYNTTEAPSADRRIARCRLAHQFIDSVLLPRIREKEDIHGSEELEQLYQVFQREHSGWGSDFDLVHVWLAACERNLRYEKIMQEAPNKVPEEALDIVVAVSLLEDILF